MYSYVRVTVKMPGDIIHARNSVLSIEKLNFKQKNVATMCHKMMLIYIFTLHQINILNLDCQVLRCASLISSVVQSFPQYTFVVYLEYFALHFSIFYQNRMLTVTYFYCPKFC
jgi:hypothetical protein